MAEPVTVRRPPPLSGPTEMQVQTLWTWCDYVVRFSKKLTQPVTVTAAYSVAAEVYEVRANGTFTVTLPPAGTTGRPILIKNIGSGTITIDGSGSETIDGSATKTLSTQYHAMGLIDNGSGWDVVFQSVTVITDHGALTGLSDNDHPQYLLVADIDDTPVNGETSAPISSNWAFDHVAAADPHTGYRLESADHTHQSTGAQAGQLDHGLALTGLTDDDHTQYLLASAATDRTTFATNWTDLTDGGETSLHSHAGSGGGITEIQAPTSVGTGTTYDITDLPDTYAYLILQVAGISHDNGSNRAPLVQLDTDNGASFDATAGNYPGGTVAADHTSAGVVNAGSNRAATNTWNITVYLWGYQGGVHPRFASINRDVGSSVNNFAYGMYIGSTTAINAIRILWNGAGNFDAGTAALYGVT